MILAPRRLLPVLTALLAAAAAVAPSAQAGWFPGESIDGPGADVLSVGDVDIAGDGTGAIAYLRRDGGVAHVFVARMLGGAWQAPERVDTGQAGPASAATLAVGNRGRFAVAFVSEGRLYGAVSPGGDKPTPVSAPQLLADASVVNPVTDPDIDLGVNGTAYVVFAQSGDVRASRFEEGGWQPVATPLDVDPAQPAGQGTGRPRIAVSAEGNAVATWAETGPGRRRVYGRRITGLVPSSAPQEVSLADLGGAAGGDADSPDIDVEDDGSFAWVTWRQDFGGVSRTVARRLIGSLFEQTTPLDGGAPSSGPRFQMNGRGVGLSVVEGPGGSILAGVLDDTNTFTSFPRLDSGGGASSPVVAAAERRQISAAWVQGDAIRARFKSADGDFEPEETISVPEFGPVAGGPRISNDERGDTAVAFIQGPEGARRLVAGVYDRPPGAPGGRTSSSFQRRSRPRLVWGAGPDLWGGQQFKVFVDRVEVATTDQTAFRLKTPLPDGRHTWRVAAVDRRGQVESSRERLLAIDAVAPTGRLRIAGKRSRGSTLTAAVSPSDPNGSGIRRISVDFGDGSRPVAKARAAHRYTRRGSFTVTARIVDRAGNVGRVTTRLRIK